MPANLDAMLFLFPVFLPMARLEFWEVQSAVLFTLASQIDANTDG